MMFYRYLIVLAFMWGAGSAFAATNVDQRIDLTRGLFVPGAAAYKNMELPLPEPIESLQWAMNMVSFTPQASMPLIAIVIDDMGVDRKRSLEMMHAMPAAVTLAFLPYASDVSVQADAARAEGHEIMVHVPMEPERDTADPGPNFLGVGFSPNDLRQRIEANLSVFAGYAGINNHMGSKFTQDQAGIDILMSEMKRRGLYFLDSRTIASSVAETTAKQYGVPTSHRDVFLDDEETHAFTKKALLKLEEVARKTGTAVAIGHPKDITRAELQAWIPTLKKKGFQLAPLSAVILQRQKEISTDVALLDIKDAIGICEVR